MKLTRPQNSTAESPSSSHCSGKGQHLSQGLLFAGTDFLKIPVQLNNVIAKLELQVSLERNCEGFGRAGV